MKKINIFLLIISLLLIISTYFLTFYHNLRLVIALIGLIMFILAFLLNNKKYLKLKIIIYPILGILIFYSLDFLLTKSLNREPVFSLEITSSNKVKTYNSLFYRVFSCDDKYYFDFNYQKNYMCQKSDIKKKTVNEFLANSKESYHKYRNKFVRLEGRISTIVADNEIQLSSYDNETIVNGYVDFNANKKIIVKNIKINPKKYYIYDQIEVIGLVSSYKNNKDKLEITLIDAVILDSDLYNKYELVVNNVNNEDKTLATEGYYYIGIQGIYYRYDEDNIYELGYLLSDKRVKFKNLIKDAEKETLEDDSILYTLDDYKVIVCKNKNILFINKDITNYDELCEKQMN